MNSHGRGGHTSLRVSADPDADNAALHPRGDAQGSTPSARRQTVVRRAHFALDWLGCILAGVTEALLTLATPRSVYIRADQLPWISYPANPNSVPVWAVPLIALVFPIAVFVAHKIINKRTGAELHLLILGLLTSVLLTGAITDMMKNPIGRLRPRFARVCWPDGNITLAPTYAPGGVQLGGFAVCSGSKHDVDEARRSFPSGHSSWSAAGLGFLTYWLMGQLWVYDGQGHPWRFMVALAPALTALVVGVTRYIDYYHFWTDVAAGLALGFAVAWGVYRLQYVPWAVEDSHQPRWVQALQAPTGPEPDRGDRAGPA